MAELYENKEAARERVILIGVCTRENENVEESLDELKELADTAGAEAVGRVIQNRESMHPGTYIGSGKIDEVRELAAELHADGVICDDELTPAQLRGLPLGCLQRPLSPFGKFRKIRHIQPPFSIHPADFFQTPAQPFRPKRVDFPVGQFPSGAALQRPRLQIHQ